MRKVIIEIYEDGSVVDNCSISHKEILIKALANIIDEHKIDPVQLTEKKIAPLKGWVCPVCGSGNNPNTSRCGCLSPYSMSGS